MSVWFRILGSVEASVDGRPLPGMAPPHLAVLGHLLLHAGSAVSADRLIEAMWGQDPPETARAPAIRRALRQADV
ncbi:MAG: AfsR/SARP family transcriptional regulator, partial [Candidatus Dormibacteraceae bacterium]